MSSANAPYCIGGRWSNDTYHMTAAVVHRSASLLLSSFVRCSARGRAMVATTGRILKGDDHANVVAIALLDVSAGFVHGSHATGGEKAVLL